MRIKDVENTPFKMLKMENEKYKLISGNHLLSNEEFDDLFEILNYIKNNTWSIIIQMILIINTKMEELKNEKGQE